MKNLTIVFCLFLASCYNCAKLPPTFIKCNRKQTDFNECLRKAAEDAIRQLNKPMKEIGLNSLEPLRVSSMTVEAGNRYVQFQQNITNLNFFNFTKIDLLKLDMNFETKTLFMDCFFSEIRWKFDYDFNGTVLSMPIKGSGPGSVILGNLKYTLTFILDEYEKEGDKYFKVVDVKCVMDIGNLKAQLENLFDGDKVLGDILNKMINENWKILYEEVRPGYEDAFGQIFFTLLNSLLANVSITELFGN